MKWGWPFAAFLAFVFSGFYYSLAFSWHEARTEVERLQQKVAACEVVIDAAREVVQ